MQLEDSDYWRDGIAMAVHDDVNKEALFDAAIMCETGEAFNMAIWAASSLDEIVEWHYSIRGANNDA
jgi:hypothetical protein